MDPKLNDQVIAWIEIRMQGLGLLGNNPDYSAEARRDATDAKRLLSKELQLRKQIRGAKSPEAGKQAEKELAAYRKTTCPKADDGHTVETCKPVALYVHLHMRFLLPSRLVENMRNPAKYPLRCANVPENIFKDRYSLEDVHVPSRTRWGGSHPVVGATVRLGGMEAKTNNEGTAKFENVPAGTHEIEVVPDKSRETTVAAGPAIPVASGYDYNAAPPYMYRRFKVKASTSAQGYWIIPQTPTIVGADNSEPPYAGIVGMTSRDLFVDWKPDWIKVRNRHSSSTKTSRSVVVHQTATIEHEWIGSVINTFDNGASGGTAAHYLVDLDGHVVKIAHEEELIYHASDSHWKELSQLNTCSIGIETVHTDYNVKKDKNGKIVHKANGDQDTVSAAREFTESQYIALIGLIKRLQARFAIDRHYVCGHNDCRDGARECPGDMFDWERIEDAGCTIKPADSKPYSGNREVEPNQVVSSASKSDLAQRLYAIGYTHKTVRDAVGRFARRAFSGSRLATRPDVDNGLFEPVAHATEGKAKPLKPRPGTEQITEVIADMIDQMYRDA